MFVPQKPFPRKQQYIDGVVEHMLIPPLPPFAHMQPFVEVLVQHTVEGSEQPLKHSASEFPQANPVHPHIY
jgi:hypothetical protein